MNEQGVASGSETPTLRPNSENTGASRPADGRGFDGADLSGAEREELVAVIRGLERDRDFWKTSDEDTNRELMAFSDACDRQSRRLRVYGEALRRIAGELPEGLAHYEATAGWEEAASIARRALGAREVREVECSRCGNVTAKSSA